MRLLKPRTIILGGLAVAAVAGALKNRDKVAGLIGVRSSAPEPWTPAAPAEPPPPANADLPRDYAGTKAGAAPDTAPDTAVAADVPPAIDERAEEEAAAAEAAAIGGSVPSYSGTEADQPASEEEHAVMEAGGGEAEGAEQAEADLLANAQTTIGEPQPGYDRIADAIQAEDSPGRWEQVEPLASTTPEPGPVDEPVAELEEDSGITSAPSWGERFRARVRERDEANARADSGEEEPDGGEPSGEAAAPAGETSAEEKSSNVWRTEDAPKPADAEEEPPGSLLAPDEQPTVEAESVDDDEGGSEWQTWSGRAVEP